jgi:hypothetical protein
LCIGPNFLDSPEATRHPDKNETSNGQWSWDLPQTPGFLRHDLQWIVEKAVKPGPIAPGFTLSIRRRIRLSLGRLLPSSARFRFAEQLKTTLSLRLRQAAA